MWGIWTDGGREDLEIVGAGQRYGQTEQFVYLGGAITAEADMTAEIRRRTETTWNAFRHTTDPPRPWRWR